MTEKIQSTSRSKAKGKGGSKSKGVTVVTIILVLIEQRSSTLTFAKGINALNAIKVNSARENLESTMTGRETLLFIFIFIYYSDSYVTSVRATSLHHRRWLKALRQSMTAATR
ncbi:hypothetical protein [Pseudobacteriovorax antillogorgiicola]|uniref:hypothetical protein n=1 Tax=Pseudobacteriovorax antillogorgiicola TaxID=1513793 RepID=UPI00117B5C33|nr:hypothetical protein [Pseudobacteriovorax antillogorgiicola]